MKKIYLSSPHMSGKELDYVNEAFQSNWIAPLGENVDCFEKEVTQLVGTKSAVALSSGTAAIHLALKALNIAKGDIVFCSSLTFAASCNPIIYENATPVFIDSERESWNMCPIALENALRIAKKINRLPKAVIVVNLYGQSADYDRLLEVCNKYQVPIIEDAAESLGATYKGKQTGSFGQFGIFSFNGNKIITTSGGGMIVSNDEESLHRIKFWATQAREKERHYEHKELGYNYRLSNVLAGIGRGQLTILSERIQQKREIYQFYQQQFADIEEIQMMPIAQYGQPNYWLSVITLDEKSRLKPIQLIELLEKEGIESRNVWKPMHRQPFFEKYPFYTAETKESVSDDLFNRGLCLPSDTKMTIADLERVVEIVKSAFHFVK